MECAVSPRHHYDDINMAVTFARSRVADFKLPEKVVPAFSITNEEIQYLEDRVRETVSKNLANANFDLNEDNKEFFEHAVRCGLNFLLQDENDPQLRWYIKEFRRKK